MCLQETGLGSGIFLATVFDLQICCLIFYFFFHPVMLLPGIYFFTVIVLLVVLDYDYPIIFRFFSRIIYFS